MGAGPQTSVCTSCRIEVEEIVLLFKGNLCSLALIQDVQEE